MRAKPSISIAIQSTMVAGIISGAPTDSPKCRTLFGSGRVAARTRFQVPR